MTMILEKTVRLTGKSMRAIRYPNQAPTTLKTNSLGIMTITHVCRLRQKERLCAFAIWQGHPVFVKLLFHRRYAKRDYQTEFDHYQMIKDKNVETPALLHHGISDDNEVHILIFEKLEGNTLEEIWSQRQSDKKVLPLLKTLIDEIAWQHERGVLQDDIHFKNFIINEETIYYIDLTTLRFSSHPFATDLCWNNIVMFLAELGMKHKKLQLDLMTRYAKKRKWSLEAEDQLRFLQDLEKWNHQRWLSLERAILKKSPEYIPIDLGRKKGLCHSDYAHLNWKKILHFSEDLFKDRPLLTPSSRQTADMANITLDNQAFIVQRFKRKKALFRRQFFFSSTLARQLWTLTHMFNLFRLKESKPVLFLENKYSFFDEISYFITENKANRPL